ncbi:MAG TPA: VWA domain-containing protein [Vicinamibacterales bacterium]|nr:VWA domain-containing protein [Vicinamibacterales bacterium]
MKLAISLVALFAMAAVPGQQRTFRSGTDVVLIDVEVLTRDGLPIEGLKSDQFEVFIDGRRRTILSSEFLRESTTMVKAKGAKTATPVASETPVKGDGRIFMLAIDQMSFPMTAQASAREAAQRVVKGLGAEDRIGIMTLPGQVRIAPTRDRAAIDAGIKQIGGLRGSLKSEKYSLSAAEASAIKSKDGQTMNDVYVRECERRYIPTRDFQNLQICRQELNQESSAITNALEQQGMTSINGLHDAIDATSSIDGRKTLVFISAGIPLSKYTGGQPNLDHELARIGRRAATANVNLYVFYLNVHFLRYFSAEYGKQNHSIFEDVSMFGYGLEKFADIAGGSFSQVEVDADPFVDRMLRETSAYYLLAVPTEASERDGKEHFIRLSVKASGATVRHRKVVVIPKETRMPRDPLT